MRPSASVFLLAWIAFVGCGGSEDERTVDTVGVERYEECDKADAEIRLDVTFSRADNPTRVGTISFYLRKVDYVGFGGPRSRSRYKDGIDDEGNSWYSQTHLGLSDITLHDARFELSHRYGENGQKPTVDLRIDTLLSLTEATKQALEDGIIVESTVIQLHANKQQNHRLQPSGGSGRS